MSLDDLIHSLAEISPDPIAIGFRGPGDRQSRFVWSNESFRRTFGYDADEIAGQSVFLVVADEEANAFRRDLAPFVTERRETFHGATLCRRKSGETFWAAISIGFVTPEADGSQFSFAFYHDLTPLKERERRAEKAREESQRFLREAEDARSRLMMAVDTIPTPFAIWDCDWRLVLCNSAFAPKLLGRDERVAPGVSVESFLAEASRSGRFLDALGREEEWAAEALAALRAGPIDEITKLTDGSIVRAISTIAPNGDVIVYNSDITDVTRQKRDLEAKNIQLELARAEANMRAHHDELTSLGNRRFVAAGLEQLTALCRSEGGEIAAMLIDLDGFKQTNDTLGHAAGDLVLREVARRLKELVRNTDLLARLGGDEFLVLRRVTGPGSDPEALGQEIVESLSQPYGMDDTEIRVGASVGIARMPLSGPEDLLTNADIALYKAKTAGRGRVVSFDERDLHEMQETRRLSDELIEALEKRAFVPVFQPQIDVATGRIVGVEALVRWHHPERGLLMPSDFLGVAAELGILYDIDALVFERALSLCLEGFTGEDAPRLSVNVSEERFLSGALLRFLSGVSEYAGGVALEMLESIFFEEQGDALRLQLDAIRDLGVAIEVDDFGSGRASIVALEQVAPDRLKIDGRLVAPVAQSERSAKLVRAIVDIGHALGIGVTAEGVETEAQVRRLTELGCDRLQGFYFGAPMPFEELLRHPCAPRSIRRAV